MRERFFATMIGFLAVAFSPARADDEAQLARALKFSREFFVKTPFVAEVNLQPHEEGSLPAHFDYERRRNVERIRTEFGQVFARRQASGWLKSDDWGKTGARATPNEVADLASRVYIVNSAWNINRTLFDKGPGANVTNLVTHTSDENGEHFVFERTREDPSNGIYPRYAFTKRSNISGSEPLLEQFSGPVVIGNQQLFLTVRYTASSEPKNERAKTKKSRVHNKQ
jgi:hypothetical protein